MDQHEAPTAEQPAAAPDAAATTDVPQQPAGAADVRDELEPDAEQAAAAAGDDVPAATDGPGDQTAEAEVEELDPELRAAEDPRTPGQLLVALEEAEATRDEYLDALQRARAEFDNYRRRATRDAQAARRLGTGDLVVRLLDALDDVDRTAAAASTSDDASLAGGVRAVQRKLAEVLVGAGVERVDETDVAFDASRHEAVQQVAAEEPVEAPEVATVLRPGYLLGDRVLRAAMVVVRQ